MIISKNRILGLLGIIVCALALLQPTSTQAQTLYVADELRVPLRSGMGNQYRIIHRGLPSGTRLEQLSSNTDADNNEWTQVRTPDGQEGWLRSQYLLNEPTAAIKLARLEEKMSQLDGDQSELLQTNERLSQQKNSLEQQVEELQTSLEQVQSDYASLKKLSANAITLNQRHKELNESYQLLQTRAEVLKTENERLQTGQRYREWLFGAGILILGIIVSLALQSMGRRKRRSEWG
ncbi:TIGR04211 family SH3 domain-containing protein [Gilvimarinus chinensis]|uniref:TIGR04211 family SH3 domain-containing protein n=1 Tax=Gilvimarinus chinensis TaxID=396005 RepID=UPI00037653E7|nr:TIGR04211 family SH3 domain-containing protein [Gilvimarinus chinensis]